MRRARLVGAGGGGGGGIGGDVLAKKSHPLADFGSPSSNIKNLGFPIIGPKKVVVNFIYGYQNLSGEKYKTNGKKLELNRTYQ